MPEARACATRMLRVYLLFPPRSCIGAHSSMVTPTPESAAARAAQRAALPPPTTSTSIPSWTSELRWSGVFTLAMIVPNPRGGGDSNLHGPNLLVEPPSVFGYFPNEVRSSAQPIAALLLYRCQSSL